MKVSKWGNSLGIRLPQAVVEALALREGDDIHVQIVGERRFDIEKSPSWDEALDRLRNNAGRLPSDFTFDRNEIYDKRL